MVTDMGMDKPMGQLTRILRESMERLHGGDLLALTVVGAMPYPMKEGKYVVTYNLRLMGRPSIMLAKVVVDLVRGDVDECEPGLL